MDACKTFSEDVDLMPKLPFKFVKVDDNRIRESITKIRRGGINFQKGSALCSLAVSNNDPSNTIDKLNEGKILELLTSIVSQNIRYPKVIYIGS